MKKYLILIIFIFYILALIQTSFLVHFSILGNIPNLILIVIFFINFFEKSQGRFGLWSSVVGGFFLDIFSCKPIGFYIFIMLLIAILIKFFLKNYVRTPVIKRI